MVCGIPASNLGRPHSAPSSRHGSTLPQPARRNSRCMANCIHARSHITLYVRSRGPRLFRDVLPHDGVLLVGPGNDRYQSKQAIRKDFLESCLSHCRNPLHVGQSKNGDAIRNSCRHLICNSGSCMERIRLRSGHHFLGLLWRGCPQSLQGQGHSTNNICNESDANHIYADPPPILYLARDESPV